MQRWSFGTSTLGAILPAVFTAFFVAGPVAAQTAPPPPSFIEQQPEGQWRARLLIGDKVTNKAGETVGKVDDLLVDNSGRVTAVVVGVGGFLGMGEKNIALPYQALSFGTDQRGDRIVTVEIAKEDMEKAPEFKPREKTALERAAPSQEGQRK